MGIFTFLFRKLFQPQNLGTDLGPAAPFLINPKTGKPVSSGGGDAAYFYHATSFGNLSNIKDVGLDPNFGGKGGASDQVGSERFKSRSANKVHATGSTDTASFYGLLKDEPSLFVKAYGDRLFQGRGVPDDPDMLNALAVILRFPRRIPGVTWEPDPDDPREAYRTTHKIAPKHIEALTTEGWTPVKSLKELDAALAS